MCLRRAIAVVLVAASALPAGASADAVTGPRETWVPDGEVKAVAVSGSTAYIGGNFARIAPYTGSSALFDATSGALEKPWPEAEGVVNAIVADGSGGWYLGGDFRSLGGVPRTDLAHVLPDRSVDPNWAPTTDGVVRALAAAGAGGLVYAGGDFSAANGQARASLASFSPDTGLLGSFTGGVSQSGLVDFKGLHTLLLRGTT